MIAFTLLLCANSVQLPTEELDAQLRERLRAQAAPLVEQAVVPGLMIGVRRGAAQSFFALGTGRDLQPPDPETRYEIGSLSKAFAGLLLADMLTRGELEPDSGLAELLPEALQDSALADPAILLRHLASHQAGLPREPENLGDDASGGRFAGYDRAQLDAYLSTVELLDGAGSTFHYSNTSVGLLGELLGARAGTDYAVVLRDRVLRPLDLVDTVFADGASRDPRLAAPTSGGRAVNEWTDFGVLRACGGLRSSARDLLRFGSAFVFPPDAEWSRRVALAAQPRVELGGGQAYAFGWFLAADRATRWHGGRTGGFSAHLAWNPEVDVVVCVLSNGTSALIDSLGISLLQLAAGLDVPPLDVAVAVALSDAELERVVGTYRGEHFEIAVTRDQHGLLAQLTGQGVLRVEAASATRLFYRAVPAELELELDAQGGVRALTLHQAGASYRCERASETR